MKKLILLASFAFIGCTASEDKQVELDCNCGIVINKAYFHTVGVSFTKLTIENNCTGEVKTIDVQGNISAVGEQYCN